VFIGVLADEHATAKAPREARVVPMEVSIQVALGEIIFAQTEVMAQFV
jgi:hypothetical protein